MSYECIIHSSVTVTGSSQDKVALISSFRQHFVLCYKPQLTQGAQYLDAELISILIRISYECILYNVFIIMSSLYIFIDHDCDDSCCCSCRCTRVDLRQFQQSKVRVQQEDVFCQCAVMSASWPQKVTLVSMKSHLALRSPNFGQSFLWTLLVIPKLKKCASMRCCFHHRRLYLMDLWIRFPLPQKTYSTIAEFCFGTLSFNIWRFPSDCTSCKLLQTMCSYLLQRHAALLHHQYASVMKDGWLIPIRQSNSSKTKSINFKSLYTIIWACPGAMRKAQLQ